jgi:hypothetical protein
MTDSTPLPPSRDVFEAEIIDMAQQPGPEERLVEMLERYFCDYWAIHNVAVDGQRKFCLHVNGHPEEGWCGDSFAHVLTVALLGEYNEQIGGEGEWKPLPRLRH